MDKVKIEEVVVGDEVGTTPVEMKTEPVFTPINGGEVETIPVEMKTEPVVTSITGSAVETMPVEIKTEPVVTPVNGSEVESIPVEMKTDPVVISITGSAVETTPVEITYPQSLQCFDCLITFPNTKAWVRHMRKSHGELYKQHLMQANTLFTCYNCEESFTSSEALSKHQVVHLTEEKPFRCTYCCKLFLSYTDMKKKHKRCEFRERQNVCTHCGATFTNYSTLRRHRMKAHSEGLDTANDDIYGCPKCGRGFEDIEELLLHQEEFADEMNCDAKLSERKRVRNAKVMNEEGSDEKKMKVSDSHAEGCSSTQLMIPCPEGDCQLIFNSIAALRTHKKEAHRPAPHKPSGSEYS